MEINYDYLRTGTAIGFRACRGLCSNYLLHSRAATALARLSHRNSVRRPSVTRVDQSKTVQARIT